MGRGRPQKEIDKEEFEKLCEFQCTRDEICDFFDVTVNTLTGWCRRTYDMSFSEIFRKKRKKGFVSLRRFQYEEARNGNTTMLVWLGKQWLGQAEKPAAEIAEQEISEEVEALLAELDME